jgi:hypothetical protein
MTNPHTAYGIIYRSNGDKGIDGTETSYGASFVGGDIISYAVDMDASTITFYKNNASQGSISFSGTVASAASVIPGGVSYADTSYFNFGQDSSFAGTETAQGNGGTGEDFYYTPPSGFKALNTDNLSDPSIALPTDHFDTQLWTGTGSGQTFSDFTFQPDFLWFKQRNGTSDHALFDSVRGVNSGLSTPTTAAANTVASASQDLVSFDDDGFTTGIPSQYGSLGSSTNTIVTWSWKAGGATTVTNNDGTTPSEVSVNSVAGFSIVSYTGTGSAATVGHGLSQTPEFFTVKSRNVGGRGWTTWVDSLTGTQALDINGTDAAYTSTTSWNSLLPTSSVLNLGTRLGTNESGTTYIGYCFNSIEGYSKVGSYSGNGSTDGSFIYTGMKPSYLLIKRTDAAFQWYVWDDKRDEINPNNKVLYPSLSDAEDDSADYSIDFLSNGFKIRNASNLDNNSSGTYIYLAFAESPFKTSNAR